MTPASWGRSVSDLLFQTIVMGAPLVVAGGAVLFAAWIGRSLRPDRLAEPQPDIE
jgi:hypothetical protein